MEYVYQWDVYVGRQREFLASCLKNIQREKNGWFFSNVDREIDEAFLMCMCKIKGAGLLYFEKLCQMNQMKSEPTSTQLFGQALADESVTIKVDAYSKIKTHRRF